MKAAKKKIKPSVGKNIRVSEEAWKQIRDYCNHKGFVMGTFVENSAIGRIPTTFKAQYHPIQETKQDK